MEDPGTHTNARRKKNTHTHSHPLAIEDVSPVQVTLLLMGDEAAWLGLCKELGLQSAMLEQTYHARTS